MKDIETLLSEERFADGWEPRILGRKGLTMTTFNRTVLKLEFGINEKKVAISSLQKAASA